MGSANEVDVDIMERIATRLSMQDYGRTYFVQQSGECELTPLQYALLAAYEFYRNIHINGFNGFQLNTDSQYDHVLPIGLAAIGARRMSGLARRRLHHDERGWPKDDEFYSCGEDLCALLTAFVAAHRSELPDPSAGSAEAIERWEAAKQEWATQAFSVESERDGEWANRVRFCPECGTEFKAAQDRGMCPRCRHVFFASQDE